MPLVIVTSGLILASAYFFIGADRTLAYQAFLLLTPDGEIPAGGEKIITGELSDERGNPISASLSMTAAGAGGANFALSNIRQEGNRISGLLTVGADSPEGSYVDITVSASSFRRRASSLFPIKITNAQTCSLATGCTTSPVPLSACEGKPAGTKIYWYICYIVEEGPEAYRQSVCRSQLVDYTCTGDGGIIIPSGRPFSIQSTTRQTVTRKDIPSCNNGICEPEKGENSANCPQDCPVTPPPSCDNGICEPEKGEYFGNCPKDCPIIPPTCTNGICEPEKGENSNNCSQDCPITPPPSCTNGICEPEKGEYSVNCPSDCPLIPLSCTNGVCEPEKGENYNNCSSDCPSTPPASCTNGACESENGEYFGNCPSDCPITLPVPSPGFMGGLLEKLRYGIGPDVPSALESVFAGTRLENLAKKTTEFVQEKNLDTAALLASTASATVATAGSAAATSLILLVTNFSYYLNLISYALRGVFLIGKRRRKLSFIIVFDSQTEKPLPGAIVRIFEAKYKKLKEMVLTDKEGKAAILADPGEYYLMVIKPGYAFPAKKTQVLEKTKNYFGGNFKITDKDEGVVKMSIPLDPLVEEKARVLTGIKKFWRNLQLFLEYINYPLLFIGTFICIFAAIMQPILVNLLILVAYLALMMTKLLGEFYYRKTAGMVKNATTGEPVDLALVRLYEISKASRLTQTRVTNAKGRFILLVEPGTYYLTCNKEGYLPHVSSSFTVKRKDAAAVYVDIKLSPQPS